MMRPSNGSIAPCPRSGSLGAKAHGLLERARQALGSRGGEDQQNVAAAIEQAYRDGIGAAGKFLEENGQAELGRALKKAEAQNTLCR